MNTTGTTVHVIHTRTNISLSIVIFIPIIVLLVVIGSMAEQSSMVRPVCHRLPSSVAVWDETNLPLSCVITPLFGQSQASAKSLAGPQTLASIPKCLRCGAPHPTNLSHYPFQSSLLCHLCGKTCPTGFEDQAVSRHEEHMDPDEYGQTMTNRSVSAAKSGEVREFSMPVLDTTSYRIPAMSCPPIWWIVVEGSPSRQYWNVVSSALSSVIANLPPYVHIGMLLASSATLSVWNVTSAVPFVHHFPWKKARPDLVLADVGTYQSHLQTALRAMGDSMVLTEGELPLIKTLELVLDQIEHGKHPGQPLTTRQASASNGNVKPYAGGRVLFLLNGPPQELKNQISENPRGSDRRTGLGGQGGACFESGMRFSTTDSGNNDGYTPALAPEDDPESGTRKTNKQTTSKSNRGNPDDLTSKNLQRHFPHVDASLMKHFGKLGQKFAEAAFGVDILVLQNHTTQAVGVPLLKPLCEPTGTPGPLLFDLTQSNSEQALRNELWHRRPLNFGGLLRVRLSPGFKVDASPVQGASRSHLELVNTQVRKGLMGPATSTHEESLWQIGSCDAHQSVTLDIQVTNKIQRVAFIDGVGEVALKPCLQVCFAYTTVVAASEDNSDEYVTVRRMRMCTLRLPMSDDIESLYAALDPEALSVVLFHKFTTSILTEGVKATQDIGRDWLKFILVCTYRSAEAACKRQESKAAQGVESEAMFYPSERLLNGDGSLSRDEILLGQGHDILRLLPLLVWCLLQCDAFRPSSDTYRPTIDARAAALMQMASMSPLVLARCIGPRLELWQSGNDAEEAISTSLGLSREAIAGQLLEHQQADPNLILFVDSPYGILVCDSHHVRATEGSDVVVGEALQKAVQQAVESYPSPPPVTWALDRNVTVGHLWKDFLVEDALTFNTHQNFDEWKKDLAASIFDELSDNSDY